MRPSRRATAAALLGSVVVAFAGAAAQAANPVRIDVLIDDGIVVTMDAQHRVLPHGAVAIDGERIVAVGPRDELRAHYAARRTIAARGRLVIPGLVNGHSHAPMTLFRGLADDREATAW